MYYGTKETRSMIISEFYGHVRKLIKNKEACFVIDDAYNQFGGAKEKAALLMEFYGSEFALFKDQHTSASLDKILEEAPAKREVIMNSLFELISQTVEKSMGFLNIVHAAMLQYLKNAKSGPEITKFLDLVREEHLDSIAFSKEGAQVVALCIAWGNAKDRKLMIRQLKSRISDLYADEWGYLVILAIMSTLR